MSFSLITLPYITYFDSNNNALTGGYIQSYNNTTGDPAPFYQDANGDSAYTNPLYFVNSGQLPPIYTDPDISAYAIEVYDSSDALVQSYTLTPFSSTDETSTASINNLIDNGQFQFYEDQSTNPAPSNEILIAENAFYFSKDGSGGEDSISFQLFSLDTTEPESTPQNYFNYTCTSAASGETYKDFIYKIQNVRSLQNTSVTFSLSACTLDSQDVYISLYIQQYFGTGGTPSGTTTTLISAYTLTTTFTNYSSIFTIASLEGEAIGTNGDDSLNIILRMPLNQTSNIGITNIYLQEGSNTSITYPFQTYAQTKSAIQSSDLPNPTPLDNEKSIVYSTPSYNSDGVYKLKRTIPVGTIMDYLGISNPDDGWYLANGQSIPIAGYFSDFYNLIGYNYTLLSGFSITSIISNVVIIQCDQIGAITSPAVIEGNSSVAISNINNGSTTTRGNFTLTFQGGSTFGKGNQGAGGDPNTQLVFYTPDGKSHTIIFPVAFLPFWLATPNSITTYNTVTFVNIGAAVSSSVVATNFSSTISLPSPHGLATSDNLFSLIILTNQVEIYNSLSGAPLNQPTIGTTPFSLTITTVGNTGVYQNYTYTVTSAASMSYGQYITCSTINYDIIFWFIIDDDGTQPDVVADFYIPISLSGTDIDSQVAASLQNAMNSFLINLPDLSSMITRSVNSSNSAINNYSYYHDPGNRFTQANISTNTLPGSLETCTYDNNVSLSFYPNWNGGTSSTATGSYVDTRPNNFAVNKIIKVY